MLFLMIKTYTLFKDENTSLSAKDFKMPVPDIKVKGDKLVLFGKSVTCQELLKSASQYGDSFCVKKDSKSFVIADAVSPSKEDHGILVNFTILWDNTEYTASLVTYIDPEIWFFDEDLDKNRTPLGHTVYITSEDYTFCSKQVRGINELCEHTIF